MSDQHIMTALQVRLAAFASAKSLSVAYEGVPVPPNAGIPSATKPHLADFLLPATTVNPSMGRDHRRYEGIYQVDVDSPVAIDAAAFNLRELANELVAHFPRGLALTHEGVKVLITRTPSISPIIPDGGRIKRSVSIRYQADVIT